ncbi:hypothetical protein GCM10028791_37840 [Echinicola sediminis]
MEYNYALHINMKPLIKKSDYESIKKILVASANMGYQKDTLPMEMELRNCEIVADHLVHDRIVRPGTTVEVQDCKYNNIIKVTLVPPHEVNVTTGHISLLAPLAVALLGFQEGHEFSWALPSGERKLKILKVE